MEIVKTENFEINIWTCQNPKGVVQLIHGAMEHIKRYDNLAKFLNNNNYIVIGSDLPGHGKNLVNNVHDLETKGEVLLQQVNVNKYVQTNYANLPIYILGHSMGSIITRNLILNQEIIYKRIILSGTLNPNLLIVRSGIIIQSVINVIEPSSKSNIVANYLSFGVFKTMSKRKYNTENWLTNDKKNYLEYNNDLLCGNPFSNTYIKELLIMVNQAISAKGLKALNQENVFILGGLEDPVSKFGKEIKDLKKKLSKVPEANIKLLKYMKHEIINEINKEQVYINILDILQDT